MTTHSKTTPPENPYPYLEGYDPKVCRAPRKAKRTVTVLRRVRDHLADRDNWFQGALCTVNGLTTRWNTETREYDRIYADNAHCEFCLLGAVELFYDHEGVEGYEDAYRNPVAAELDKTSAKLYGMEAHEVNDGLYHKRPGNAHRATLKIIDKTIERLEAKKS